MPSACFDASSNLSTCWKHAEGMSLRYGVIVLGDLIQPPLEIILLSGGGCPKTYWDIKQIALVNFYLFYYSCLTLYIIETQLFCLYL